MIGVTVTAEDTVSKRQFKPSWQDVEGERFKKQVPRLEGTQDVKPERAFRWAHRQQIESYGREGIPSGTYFSVEPDARYRASDHALISVPYSDQDFRVSENLAGEMNLSTTRPIPGSKMERHEQ